MAWASNDTEEIVTEAACLAGLTALALARGPRWLWILAVPIPAFVLFHERLEIRHWVAYGPAALSIAMAIWADRAWREN